MWVCSATSWSMHPAVQVGGCPATLPRNSRACRCPLPFYTLGPPSPWACMLGSTHWLGQYLQATYKLRVVQTRIGWAVCAATIALLLLSCPSMAVVLAVGLVSFFDIDCSVPSMNCFNLLRVTPSPPPPRGGGRHSGRGCHRACCLDPPTHLRLFAPSDSDESVDCAFASCAWFPSPLACPTNQLCATLKRECTTHVQLPNNNNNLTRTRQSWFWLCSPIRMQCMPKPAAHDVTRLVKAASHLRTILEVLEAPTTPWGHVWIAHVPQFLQWWGTLELRLGGWEALEPPPPPPAGCCGGASPVVCPTGPQD